MEVKSVELMYRGTAVSLAFIDGEAKCLSTHNFEVPNKWTKLAENGPELSADGLCQIGRHATDVYFESLCSQNGQARGG
jgi:hypothetical protein